MRSYYRELCLIAAVAVASFGASWGGHALWVTTHPEQMRDADDWVRKYVSFAPGQESRFAKIEARLEPQEQRLIHDIRSANAALGAAIVEDGGYSPRVAAGADTVQHVQSALQHTLLRNFFTLQEPLTPEQRQTLNRKAAEALANND